MPFISVVFTLYSPQLYQSLTNRTHAPSTSFLFPFLNNPLSPISTSHGYEFSPWSMVNILGATTLKKIDLPLRTMSCQELGMGPYELSCTHTAMLIGSILCRLCALSSWAQWSWAQCFARCPSLWLLRSSCSFLHVFSDPLGDGVRYRCPIDDWTHCWHSHTSTSLKSLVLTVIHCCGSLLCTESCDNLWVERHI